MTIKGNQSKTLKRNQRMERAKQWLATYNGEKNKIVKNYRKLFHVDILCALKELIELGVEFPPGYVDMMKHNEECRREQMAREKAKKQARRLAVMYPDSDGTFYYIAGYTSGGAPYGVTWEEMGLEPFEGQDDFEDVF